MRRFSPDAILFDLDGLLVDSEPVWGRAEQAIMAAWDAPWTEADMDACRGTGIAETAAKMAARAGRSFDPARDPEALVEGFLSLTAQVAEQPGARALIEAALAAGVRIAVASSSTRRVVRAVLEARDLLRFFEVVTTGDEVAKKKPDPAIFLLAAERLGVAPARCVVLEDSMPGVMGARNAGIPVIAVPEVDRAAFEGVADAVAASLVEARAMLGL